MAFLREWRIARRSSKRSGPNAVRTAFLCALAICAAGSFATAAHAETRSLKLYYLHTGEKATITYKKNGRYLPAGLKKVNWFLRDWRRNEPAKMDPNLLDLVWEAYRRSGSRGYIHVISGYRSPASNEMLRKRGRGVAKNSQHTRGKALDFFLPDVKLSKLRAIGLKMEVGGVGYYPSSGSPFVHMDTGNVRHWPRMNRRQLAKVFPDGKTMHIPTDGKPLARYKQAVAAYKRRKAKGSLVPVSAGGNDLNFFQRLAGLTKRDQEDDEENNTAPIPRAVATSVKSTQPADNADALIAALPNNIPVPTFAPRAAQLGSGSEIALATAFPDEAAAPPQPAATPQPVDTPVAANAIAALALPVPADRPDDPGPTEEPVEMASREAEPPAGSDISSNVLALLDAGAGERPTSVGAAAALTPSEIEDLRRTAIPTAKKTIAKATVAKTADQKPAETANPPRQLASLDTTPVVNTPTERIETPLAETADTKATDTKATDTKAKTDGSEIFQTALLAPTETGGSRFGEVPVPAQNPALTQNIRTASIPKTAAKTERQPALSLSGLAVPTPNPRGSTEIDRQDGILMASLDSAPAPRTRPQTTTFTPDIPARTISLDAFSAPRQNSSTIGQWALSAELTIHDLSRVQAPAYGRNMIRELPETIIVQGFQAPVFGPGRNAFSGKAVTAARYLRVQSQ